MIFMKTVGDDSELQACCFLHFIINRLIFVNEQEVIFEI